MVLGDGLPILLYQLMRHFRAESIAYSERVKKTSNVNQTRGFLENDGMLWVNYSISKQCDT